MRDANPTLVAYLATRPNCYQADLFRFTLVDGTVYCWTSFEMNIRSGAYVYSGRSVPLISRKKWSIKNTIEIPEMDVEIFSNGSDMPDGSNLKLLAHNGLFDYAQCAMARVFMPTPGDTSLGEVPIFSGYTADVQIDALSVTMTVKGANLQLSQYMPRNEYMPGCTHVLFDPQCAPNPGQPGGGPSRAAYTVAATVGAGSSRTFIFWGGAPPANTANLGLGAVRFTSGTSQGITRNIPSGLADNTGFALAYPLYETPAVGDTFNVTYGCDRSRGGKGCAFYNNLQHYRGFPYIPPAEFGV